MSSVFAAECLFSCVVPTALFHTTQPRFLEKHTLHELENIEPTKRKLPEQFLVVVAKKSYHVIKQIVYMLCTIIESLILTIPLWVSTRQSAPIKITDELDRLLPKKTNVMTKEDKLLLKKKVMKMYYICKTT